MNPSMPEPDTSPIAIGRRGMLTRCGMGFGSMGAGWDAERRCSGIGTRSGIAESDAAEACSVSVED